jgi:SAM-dependent methyltransferase
LELLLDENLISDLSENSRLSENSDAISTGVALNIFLKEGDRILLSPGLFPLLQTKSEKSMRLWIKNFINVSSKVFSPNCIISAIRSGEVQWQNAFGINITNPFDLMKDYPEIFTNLMEGMHQANVTDSVFVSPKINLTDCKTVLDIGGASGALGLSLCDLYKNIESFYIYDLHTAIDLYKSMHARYRGNSAAPVKYLPGDFFQQTESGSLFGIEPSQKFDAIILGWIIHDWDDDRSVEILSKAKSHLKKDGKLILLEAVLPDSRLGNATMLDITMLIQTGGKERTLAEYKDLLGKSGLALKEVLQTEGRRQIITAGIA